MQAELINNLKQTHLAMHNMASQLDDQDYRTQYHTDLSPFGWHVGHCVFIESYWLREVILGDDSLTAELDWLYIPENILKPKRGPALPPIDEHLAWCQNIANENAVIFSNPPTRLSQHALSENNYIMSFLIQHHSQHLETMAMVLTQRQRQLKPEPGCIEPLKASTDIHYDFKHVKGGDVTIGSPFEPAAFDNEVPPQTVHLENFALADHPVTNADWMTFIENKGYHQKLLWSDAGWQWREQIGITHPEAWGRNEAGDIYEISAHGAGNLDPEKSVSGINYFEAHAYINWLRETVHDYKQVRLPHEYEWEVADKTRTLNHTGEVWEWCDNCFHPYPGFSPFPYDNYSKPWFDNNHFSLRGGSPYTQPSIRRSSFRNFYNPDKRHIFSGLRLAIAPD